tara:strand:- start:1691 stop:2101 length:411 start_codon:yes stop_codon:yes gene_type:complete
MDLFQRYDYKSHANLDLTWKLECDAISDGEWSVLARIISELESRPFSDVVGIPRGGVKLENEMLNYVSGNKNDPVLIVDDVWTTGTSFKEFVGIHVIEKMTEHVGWFGWCIFARTQTSNHVTALFQMPETYGHPGY